MNLHGYSHGRGKPLPRQADVGVDAWDFRPVGLEANAARIGTRIGGLGATRPWLTRRSLSPGPWGSAASHLPLALRS